MMTPTEERYEKLLADVNRESERYNGMHQIAVMEIDRLRAALDGLLERYTGLVNSGDAGFWDPEGEPEVVAAREALARVADSSGDRGGK
jgi:hypothetical protein